MSRAHNAGQDVGMEINTNCFGHFAASTNSSSTPGKSYCAADVFRIDKEYIHSYALARVILFNRNDCFDNLKGNRNKTVVRAS